MDETSLRAREMCQDWVWRWAIKPAGQASDQTARAGDAGAAPGGGRPRSAASHRGREVLPVAGRHRRRRQGRRRSVEDDRNEKEDHRHNMHEGTPSPGR